MLEKLSGHACNNLFTSEAAKVAKENSCNSTLAMSRESRSVETQAGGAPLVTNARATSTCKPVRQAVFIKTFVVLIGWDLWPST
jgi:hypothetical protein